MEGEGADADDDDDDDDDETEDGDEGSRIDELFVEGDALLYMAANLSGIITPEASILSLLSIQPGLALFLGDAMRYVLRRALSREVFDCGDLLIAINRTCVTQSNNKMMRSLENV